MALICSYCNQSCFEWYGRYETTTTFNDVATREIFDSGLLVSDDLNIVEPTTNILKFDSSELELYPVVRGPTSGQFSIWIQGYPSSNGIYFNTKVRFSSIFGERSFTAQCDAYVDEMGLRCDVSIPKASALEVGDTAVAVSWMGQRGYYRVKTRHHIFSVIYVRVSNLRQNRC